MVYAGALATVVSIEGARMTVRSDRGRKIVFDNREFMNIDLGYASTIYGSCGWLERCTVISRPGVRGSDRR
jgi:ATP-dependent exoDNAse (exonuclease V) alpha subunit